MIREVKFEREEGGMKEIVGGLKGKGMKEMEEGKGMWEEYGVDGYKSCEESEGMWLENGKWGQVVGWGMGVKKGWKKGGEGGEGMGMGLE